MSVYEIPLSATPQTFFIDLAGTEYKLTFKWCEPMEAWVLDLATAQEVPFIMGIPVVPGVDLLKPYGYKGVGGSLFVQVLGDVNAMPRFDNLGTSALLFFVTP